jgi:PPK2 family polyphosphate:nucleotide phosphotransferase
MTNLIEHFRVQPQQSLDLEKISTKEVFEMTKEEAKAQLKAFQQQMNELQERLYASDSHSLLIIFQAMDAAGKDGAIKHVMSGLNPQGCQVFSFKTPTSQDYEHDFLWRHYKALPERGRIGIHNRSHYEYVLVCKVHPSYNEAERIPGYRKAEQLDAAFWEGRYESIRQLEAHLERNGTQVLKFFLHVSKKEQKKRFLERIEDPLKNWKFSSSDIEERGHWNTYMNVYAEALSKTSTEKSPWYIIPADKKWFARYAIGKIITHTLEELEPSFPTLSSSQQDKLATCKDQLEKE